MTNYTKGPWNWFAMSYCEDGEGNVWVDDYVVESVSEDCNIAHISCAQDFDDTELIEEAPVNAALIAASPDLYESLKELVAFNIKQYGIAKGQIKEASPIGRAQAAIKKAEGM